MLHDTSAPDAASLIDAGPIGRYQVFVIGMCGALLFLDGLDFNMMSFLSSTLAKEWSLGTPAMSLIFSAALISAALTALVNGPMADRWGRRNLMVAYVAIFGLFSFLGAFAHDAAQFAILRFAAGIGLGGALPNGIALGVEFAPARHRSFIAVILVSLYGLGQSAGGALTAALLHGHGWRFIVGLGGILALMLFVLLLFCLPESIRFLGQRAANRARVVQLLRRIRPQWRDEGAASLLSQDSQARSPVRAIFAENRAPVTITLLIIVGLNNAQITFWLFWLPIVVTSSGLTIAAAFSTVSVMVLSGIAGSLVLGRLADRFGHYPVLLGTNVLAIGAVVLFGMTVGRMPSMLLVGAAVGIGVNGFQAVANSFAASFYPTSMRATGAGTVVAIGRLVGVLGPPLGGLFMSFHLSVPLFFALDAVIVAMCGLCLLSTWGKRPSAAARSAALTAS